MVGSGLLWALAGVAFVYGVSWWILERWPEIEAVGLDKRPVPAERPNPRLSHPVLKV